MQNMCSGKYTTMGRLPLLFAAMVCALDNGPFGYGYGLDINMHMHMHMNMDVYIEIYVLLLLDPHGGTGELVLEWKKLWKDLSIRNQCGSCKDLKAARYECGAL